MFRSIRISGKFDCAAWAGLQLENGMVCVYLDLKSFCILVKFGHYPKNETGQKLERQCYE